MPSAPARAPTMNVATWAALVLLSLIWGGSFLFGRIAVQEITPLTLVFARVGLAAVTLNVALVFFRHVWRSFEGALAGFRNHGHAQQHRALRPHL